MSLQSELLAKVTAVLNKMNLWETNAKKTEELEEMEEVDASSLVRVSVGGVSKKLELQKLIDASVSTTYNQFIASGELTFIDNELTVPASQWLINAVNYQKLTSTVIEIPFSATGKTRIDLIYANTSNQILKETGFETIGVAIPPTLPLNAVEVTRIVVTESEIEPTTLAITTDQLNAIQNSNSPSASNPFATVEDLETATSNASKEDKVSGVIALGTDDYTTTVPDVTALVAGYKILCAFQNSNTGASTINVNGLGVKEIRKEVDVQLVADDLLGAHWLMYDGTYFQLVGSGGSSGGGSISFDSTPTAGSTNAVTSEGIKDYVDGLVVGLWDDRGSFDASSNTFPSSGGSGTSGAILKGDIWTISVAGTLGSQVVEVGDTVRSLVDSPSTTPTNWAIQQNNIGYVPENSVNKATTMTGNTTSNIVFLTAKAIYDWAVGKFQDILVSGTNIKTLNGNSLLGSGNLVVGGGVSLPSPYFRNTVPSNLIPSTTTILSVFSDYYTADSVTTIENCTILSSNYVGMGQYDFLVQSGATEEDVDITINNGTTVVFSGVLPIILGVVYIPTSADWEDITGSADYSVSGEVSIVTFGTEGRATYNKIISSAVIWSVYATVQPSPLHSYVSSNEGTDFYEFIDQTTSDVRSFRYYFSGPFYGAIAYFLNGTQIGTLQFITKSPTGFPVAFRFLNDASNFKIYANNTLLFTLTKLSNNQKFRVKSEHYDLKSIKYVEQS